jgi:UDPglucose 6-dehydrogenase
MKIGIIGLGYVGSACENLFKEYFEVNTYDIAKDSNCKSVKELASKSDVIFVCLPTPMKSDRSCDLSIIKNVLSEINQYNTNSIIIIKSTVEVGTTDSFEKKYKNLKLVFNPEFLTEANFLDDFKNQKRIIIGSNSKESAKIVNDLYRKIYSEDSKVVIEYTSALNAEFVKYVTNTFLTVKVAFANEIYDITKAMNADYDEIIKLATLDKRLGSSHWSVPGPDGRRGFGGSCFPKDINSLINSFESQEIKSFVLKSAWKRNILIDRVDKDWEKLKGRAVSKENE